jgi:uncharacterized membrane protein YqjE
MARYRTGNNESDLIQGNTVYSSEGEKIGQVEEAYYGVTGRVEWIGVTGDGLAGRGLLLPMKTAQVRSGSIYLPYSTQEAMSAPDDIDGGDVPEEAERWLYAHYDSQPSEQDSGNGVVEQAGTVGQGQRATMGWWEQVIGRLSVAAVALEERFGLDDGNQPTLAEDIQRGRQEAVGVGRDFADIARDIGALTQQELQLARAEVAEQMRPISQALIWGAVAAIFGLFVAAFLLVGVMFALALVFPLWVSALITMGISGILAAGAGLFAYGRFRQVRLMPQRTMQSVQEDVKWLGSQLKSNGR